MITSKGFQCKTIIGFKSVTSKRKERKRKRKKKGKQANKKERKQKTRKRKNRGSKKLTKKIKRFKYSAPVDGMFFIWKFANDFKKYNCLRCFSTGGQM